MVKLSQRMQAVAQMVTPGNIVADVGTDHGYVPIALVQQQIIPKAIAMDLRPGPLERAREHIKQSGLTELIDTRLGDGVSALSEGEAETILIAGMGGELVIKILTQGEQICHSAKELVLQPQSNLSEVRKFLREHGYQFLQEEMVFEEGKYYSMMKVSFCGECQLVEEDRTVGTELLPSELLCKIYDSYGFILLEKKHPVLIQFLKKQKEQLEGIRAGLKEQTQTKSIVSRLQEVEELLLLHHYACQLCLGEENRI